ncbi:MAG: hypothetical protein GXO66_05485 [Euryarchaeota archaeon]|nr:hypothetical protein [Euryarchaeota archaeon]
MGARHTSTTWRASSRDRSAVEVISSGGSTHYWRNTTDISCVRCHVRIKLGNIGNAQGSQHAGDVTDTVAMYNIASGSPYHPGHQNSSYGGATDASELPQEQEL